MLRFEKTMMVSKKTRPSPVTPSPNFGYFRLGERAGVSVVPEASDEVTGVPETTAVTASPLSRQKWQSTAYHVQIHWENDGLRIRRNGNAWWVDWRPRAKPEHGLVNEPT